MITILYIPFSMSEETDLIERAIAWDNQKSGDKILIVRYGEGELELPEEEELQIYVLAHGICDPQFIEQHKLYQHVCAGTTIGFKILSIGEVGTRFQEEFLYYKTNIKDIKLYFCNLTDTNEHIARQFQQSLLDHQFQNKRIYHYQGILFPPEKDGHKYSKDKNGIVTRCSHRRSYLFCKPEDSIDMEERHKNRLALFKPKNFELSRENRTKKQEEIRREKRLEKLRPHRQGLL